MKNQKVRKEDILNEKEFYKRKIIDMINQIEDLWILEQISKCIVNITK